MLVSPSSIKQLTPLQKKIRAIAGQVYRQGPQLDGLNTFKEIESATHQLVELGNLNPLILKTPEDRSKLTELMRNTLSLQRPIWFRPNATIFNLKNAQETLALVQQMLVTQKIGNCKEFNLQFQELLYKAGINTMMLQAPIKNSKRMHACTEHYFLATLLNPTSNLNDPNTWGNEAMILDAWMPVIASASHALERFKQVLKVDETLGESLVFKGDDLYTRISPYTPKQHEYLLNRKSP